MQRGSNTRSSLLWEVERLINELAERERERGELPQILLMENVPQVHSGKNLNNFHNWIGFLNNKGYTSYYQDLNAADYGIPQHRERCFMVSILGKHSFSFPSAIELKTNMNDYLEQEVAEKYYVKSAMADRLIKDLLDRGVLENFYRPLAKSIRIGGGGSLDRHEWDMVICKK